MRSMTGNVRLNALALLLGLGLLTAGCSIRTSQLSPDDPRVQAANKAMAIWQERCKTAGVKIYRTVENVDGIYVLKRRPEKHDFETSAAVDPYGDDFPGDGYLLGFLKGSYEFDVRYSRKNVEGEQPPPKGYLYVEAINPGNGQRYKYTGSIKEIIHTSSVMMGGDGKSTFKTKDFVLEGTPASGPMPRYGVTFDDISTTEERGYWLAGSSLRVIDLQTNEVIAERIGYMVDPGQGNTLGGRTPWLVAANYACPAFTRGASQPPRNHASAYQTRQTQYFLEQVLKPSEGK